MLRTNLKLTGLLTALLVVAAALTLPVRAQSTFCNDVDGNTLWCPCAQPPQSGAVDGCVNSCTDGALLELVSTSPLRLRVSGTCRRTTVLLLRSPNAPGLPSLGGNGLRCMPAFSTVPVAARFTSAGSAEWTLPPQPTGTHYYQAWFRDAGWHCLGNASNTSNGVVVP
jgi:hypothetical protein